MKSKDIIKELSNLGSKLESHEEKQVIAAAVLEITRLDDENKSVWNLIDEIKKADIKNYKKQMEALAAEKILSVMTLNRRKTHESN